MKNLLFIAFLFVVATSYAQSGKAITVTASEADSSKGAETDYQTLGKVFTGEDVMIQSLFTNLGGTTDGTVELMESVDGTSYRLIPDSRVTSVSSDTATMTNGAVWIWHVSEAKGKIRTKISGTSGDTTLITTKYFY